VFLPWALQLDGCYLLDRGQLVYGTLGMTSGLPPPVDSQEFHVQQVAGALFRHARYLLPAGHAGALGGHSPKTSPILRRNRQIAHALVDFLWAHIGWVVVENREHRQIRFYERYARDILRDRFYLSIGAACEVDLVLSWARRAVLSGRPGHRLGTDRSIPWWSAVWSELGGLGCSAADVTVLARHLVGQLADASLGVSDLRDG